MTRPLWVDPTEAHFPPLESAIEVDIAVVGAGFSGLGAAWALRETGASVAVLESRTVASGASGRNAGFVLSGPAMSYGDSAAAIGAEQTAEIFAFTSRNRALLVEIIDTYGIECGYLRRGSMSLAASAEEWSAIQQDADSLSRTGVPVCCVTRVDLPRPFDRLYEGGIYYGGNGEIDPGRFLRGMSAALRESIQIFELSPVTALTRRGRWTLEMANGSVSAARVVLATNAYADSLLPQVPITPTRGQVLATIPLPRVVVPFPMYANYGYQYWRQTAEGALVIGGWRNLDVPTEVGRVEELNPIIQAALEGFANEIIGEPPRVDYRWAGIMGFTPDRYPLVGPVPERDGLYIAAGYSGHGVAMAFLCGAEVGRLAAGLPTDLPTSFDPARLV